MATGVPFAPTPFASTVVAPQTASAFRRASYVTPSEYRFAPTAVASTALVSKSTNQLTDSLASLAMVIERASSWADLICFHRADGTLAASVTTESMWVKAKPDGSLALICNFKPVLEVTGLGLGYNPSQITNIDSNTASNIWIDGKVIWVPGTGTQIAPPNDVPLAVQLGGWSNAFAVWTYVNGYPLTTLTANAAQGASSLTVAPSSPDGSTVVGIYPGSQLTINDGPSTEIVVASAAPTGLSIPLLTPTQYAHNIPEAPDAIRVAALPRAIEQAVISLTSCLIKTQGSRAMQMPQMPGGMPTKPAMLLAGGLEDYEIACRLLKPYTVTVMHG